MADEVKMKKGEAAPLEGALGSEIMGVLNLAFTSMTLGMCQQLTLKVGAALPSPGVQPPALNALKSTAAPVTKMTMAMPKPPTFTH